MNLAQPARVWHIVVVCFRKSCGRRSEPLCFIPAVFQLIHKNVLAVPPAGQGRMCSERQLRASTGKPWFGGPAPHPAPPSGLRRAPCRVSQEQGAPDTGYESILHILTVSVALQNPPCPRMVLNRFNQQNSDSFGRSRDAADYGLSKVFSGTQPPCHQSASLGEKRGPAPRAQCAAGQLSLFASEPLGKWSGE